MFGLWAILKSPLVIGTDLRKLSKAALKILTAEEVIAVNQDKLGVAGDLVYKEGPEEVSFLVASPSGQALQVAERRLCHVSHVTASAGDWPWVLHQPNVTSHLLPGGGFRSQASNLLLIMCRCTLGL